MSSGFQASARSNVAPFKVMNIVREVTRLRSLGKDVISLCVGEPSAGAPQGVIDRAITTLSDGTYLGYAQPLGLEALRTELQAHYLRWYNVHVPLHNIALATGSSGAFTLAFLAAFDAGAKVALPSPGYPAYRNTLQALGVDVIDVPCGPEQGYVLSPEMLAELGPLDGVVLASPNNPTGTITGRKAFAALSAWCEENTVRLISDEIYHGITYDQPAADSRGVCAWEFTQNSVVISSFSKYWAMTGWRLGWALVPDDLLPSFDALAGNLSLCPPVPAQHAALAAFSEDSYSLADAAVADFAAARSALLAALPNLGWVNVSPADGAFYVYADISPVLGSYACAADYCAALLQSELVAMTPGDDFDPLNGQNFVRISFACGPTLIAEAITRILCFQGQ